MKKVIICRYFFGNLSERAEYSLKERRNEIVCALFIIILFARTHDAPAIRMGVRVTFASRKIKYTISHSG